MTQRHFLFTLHPLSTIIFATATVLAFVLPRNSNFNFYCYTQREATPTQKSARKCAANLSRLLSRKITKSIHSSKPTSLNRPTVSLSLRPSPPPPPNTPLPPPPPTPHLLGPRSLLERLRRQLGLKSGGLRNSYGAVVCETQPVNHWRL